jgi:hypothetical protein
MGRWRITGNPEVTLRSRITSGLQREQACKTYRVHSGLRNTENFFANVTLLFRVPERQRLQLRIKRMRCSFMSVVKRPHRFFLVNLFLFLTLDIAMHPPCANAQDIGMDFKNRLGVLAGPTLDHASIHEKQKSTISLEGETTNHALIGSAVAEHFKATGRPMVFYLCCWGNEQPWEWRNPGFDGGILPVNRNISDHGFTAEWSIPFIARGVRAEGTSDSIMGLDTTALGISFIEVADPYQSVNRSLKYVLLFLVLVFLSYFIFEVTTGKRVHPAQYILVGIAQIIFYLLLLSFAERIGFEHGFLLAGAATVTLLSLNAGWIFSSRLQGARAFVVFTFLYTLIYLLLTLEDNALFVGAIASFLAVAIAMYFTRKIDWYSVLPAAVAPPYASAIVPPGTGSAPEVSDAK